MLLTLGGIFLFFILAYSSGTHHSERALDIVKKNRIERTEKWRVINRKLKSLERQNEELRSIIKEGNI